MFQVHVNQHLHQGQASDRGVFVVARDGEVLEQEARVVQLLRPARTVYRPAEPLYPASHIVAWIETEGPIEVDGRLME